MAGQEYNIIECVAGRLYEPIGPFDRQLPADWTVMDSSTRRSFVELIRRRIDAISVQPVSTWVGGCWGGGPSAYVRFINVRSTHSISNCSSWTTSSPARPHRYQFLQHQQQQQLRVLFTWLPSLCRGA